MTFKKGDRVTRKFTASADEPASIVKSDASGETAAHRESALSRRN